MSKEISQQNEEWMNAPMGTLKEQSLREFTKKARRKLDEYECNSPTILKVWLKEACGIIDVAEAIKDELLGIKEIIQTESDKLDAQIKDGKHDDAWPKPEYIKDDDWARMIGERNVYHRILNLFEAAIAKAKAQSKQSVTPEM